MGKKKVLIIGLDGATWSVIDDVVLARSMPTLKKLKQIDKVAYVRFASVYREFNDISQFKKEVALIKK